ncbi:PREDICTED: uncharacterized protein LOC104765689 [Camelina sativa]|uniref:Uncharacterized protein LOC104765689 n=1 Tax=Camelina sativa TaxID=90675 RepID=A0ABM0XLK9_CAMSA|nr:PREDICTED: uncharacterized protein LOC104765689 [Camelina sativa]
MEFPPLPERSKRLHNFTLPYLRWGQQRFLRCVKLPPHHHHHRSSPSSSSPPDHHRTRSNNAGGEELTLDLLYDAGNNKPKQLSSVLGNVGGDERNNTNGSGDVVAVSVAARPWNLRTRRAACNEPGDESTRIIESSSSSSLLLRRHEIGGGVKRGGGSSEDHIHGDGDLHNKVKFSVSLLREEIEQDFSALIGKKPPRRPKKRPRLVQKQINNLLPGLWLGEEVTADSYDVPEAVET